MKLVLWACILCVAFGKKRHYSFDHEKSSSSNQKDFTGFHYPLNPSLNIPYGLWNENFPPVYQPPGKSVTNYPWNSEGEATPRRSHRGPGTPSGDRCTPSPGGPTGPGGSSGPGGPSSPRSPSGHRSPSRPGGPTGSGGVRSSGGPASPFCAGGSGGGSGSGGPASPVGAGGSGGVRGSGGPASSRGACGSGGAGGSGGPASPFGACGSRGVGGSGEAPEAPAPAGGSAALAVPGAPAPFVLLPPASAPGLAPARAYPYVAYSNMPTAPSAPEASAGKPGEPAAAIAEAIAHQPSAGKPASDPASGGKAAPGPATAAAGKAEALKPAALAFLPTKLEDERGQATLASDPIPFISERPALGQGRTEIF
ncbi:proline-rich protein 27 [Perognathus longimembris pacificus]|uniref:proline-rich protein 27 n=1 Tax=Perognathus longimembris pacificus TaxID=214514 RepID=UPI002019EE44|nr:proline-rich protein 27 [Perognathus longimembris pacificus]